MKLITSAVHKCIGRRPGISEAMELDFRISAGAAIAALMTVTTIAQAEDWGTPYAEVRGWTVFMSQESACHATRTLNQQMQMGMHLTPVGNWELIFSTNTPHDTSRPGQFTIDGRVYNDDFYSWEAWYRLVFDEPLRAAVAAGNSMTVTTEARATDEPKENSIPPRIRTIV